MPVEVVGALVAFVAAVIGWLIPAPYSKPSSDLISAFLKGWLSDSPPSSAPSAVAEKLQAAARSGSLPPAVSSAVLHSSTADLIAAVEAARR